MCPACLASAALMAGSITTGGGAAAMLVKLFRSKKNNHASTTTLDKQRRKADADRNPKQTGNASSCFSLKVGRSAQGSSAQVERIHAPAR
jgi:hypothetical protein